MVPVLVLAKLRFVNSYRNVAKVLGDLEGLEVKVIGTRLIDGKAIHLVELRGNSGALRRARGLL